MFSFFKGEPTHYVIKYVGGRVAREGAGLAFYYLRHNTQIVTVPTTSTDASFVFNEVTNNHQAVTIQGQFTYRIRDPKQAATLLNFTIDLYRRSYVSDDPEQLSQRVANVIQVETRAEVQQRSLEETLTQSSAMSTEVLARLQTSPLLQPLGVELLSIYFLSVKPTPEMAKALEADYRESLLRRADEAVYARRAAAVDEERKIKERELETERTLEQQREQLIRLQGENARREAEHRGQVLELDAQARARANEVEWQARNRALEAELTTYGKLDPRSLLALGLREIGLNAGKIGNLTITPEVLAELLNVNAQSGKA